MEKPNPTAQHFSPRLAAAPAPVSFLTWGWGGKGGEDDWKAAVVSTLAVL